MTNPTFTLRSAEDILAMVPFLLGFHPTRSLVLLTFGPGGRPFHARIDLPETSGDHREVLEALLGAVRANEVRTVAMVAYADDAKDCTLVCRRLVKALSRSGVRVVDAIRADGHFWYSATSADVIGNAYDLSTHPITAECVLAGQVALPSRKGLADTLVGTDPDDTEAVGEAAAAFDLPERGSSTAGESMTEHALWLRERVRTYLTDGVPLPVADAGRAAALIRVDEVRDVAWAEMSRECATQHVALWRDLARRVPHDLLPGVAALLGFAAWLAGDGALAWCAVDRCREVDPDYPMAALVAEALARAVPPTTWSPIPESALPVLRPGWWQDAS